MTGGGVVVVRCPDKTPWGRFAVGANKREREREKEDKKHVGCKLETENGRLKESQKSCTVSLSLQPT